MKRTRGRPKKVDVEKKDRLRKSLDMHKTVLLFIIQLSLCLIFFCAGVLCVSNETIFAWFGCLFGMLVIVSVINLDRITK